MTGTGLDPRTAPTLPKDGKVLRSVGRGLLSAVWLAALSAGSTALVNHFKPPLDFYLALLAVSGTIVALVPAIASLATQAMRLLAEYWLGRVEAGGNTTERARRATVGEPFVRAAQHAGVHAWRASLYLFVAFILNVVAAFRPDVHLLHRTLLLGELLLGLAMGFLVAGLARFYWFTRWALQLGVIRQVVEALQAAKN